MPAVSTDEIHERYLQKAIAEINELGDELAARGETGCIATVLPDRGDRYFVPLKWERC